MEGSASERKAGEPALRALRHRYLPSIVDEREPTDEDQPGTPGADAVLTPTTNRS